MNLDGTIIDLTAPLCEKTHCYPSDPPYRHHWHVTYADAQVNLSRLDMGAHSGSHVDAPLHFLDGGDDITALPPERFLGPAVAVDCPKDAGQNIEPADFADADIRAGDIVLFRTGWEDRSCTPAFFEGDWPAFGSEAVDQLLERKVKAVGGDIASVDNPSGIAAGAVAHRKFMAAGLPLFEGLVNLKTVTGRRFFFIGIPLKLVGCEASPVRALAILET
jgi:kynurenine formamidase